MWVSWIQPRYSLFQGMLGQQSSVFNGQYKNNFKADLVLDELRVWDHVRSEDEISTHRNMGIKIDSGLNLAFDWDDTDGDDSIVQDASGMVGGIVIAFYGFDNVGCWEETLSCVNVTGFRKVTYVVIIACIAHT